MCFLFRVSCHRPYAVRYKIKSYRLKAKELARSHVHILEKSAIPPSGQMIQIICKGITMNGKFYISIIIFMIYNASLWGKTEVDSKVYSLKDVKTMDLDLGFVDVDVIKGEKKSATLTLKHTFSGELSHECRLVLDGELKGSHLEIKTDYQISAWSRNCDVKRNLKIELGSFESGEITLDLKHGDLSWADIRLAELNLDVSHGEIYIEHANVSKFNLENRHGKVKLGTLEFKDATIKAPHSPTKAEKISGERFNLEISHEDFKADLVMVNNFRGENHHGDIIIESIQGESVRIMGKHGDVDIEGQLSNFFVTARHGDVSFEGSVEKKTEISNTHGPIRLEGLFSQVIIDGSHSSIKLDQLKESKNLNIEARTNHDDIDINLPKSTSAELDLTADDVQVRDGSGRKSYRKGHVLINGAKNKVYAKANHGDVSLRLVN